MIVEVYGLTIDMILVARIVALIIFIIVAWRLVTLQHRVNHIEAQTEHNFNDLRVKLADAIGIAEESVDRDKERHDNEEI